MRAFVSFSTSSFSGIESMMNDINSRHIDDEVPGAFVVDDIFVVWDFIVQNLQQGALCLQYKLVI
jgi:hypothetical protein